MNFYLMRHGRTYWNELGILQGGMDSPLTAESILEIKRIKKTLSDLSMDFDRVFSSPAERAISTGRHLDFSQIQELEFFRELGMGELEGKDYEFFKKNFQKEYFDYFNDAVSYDPTAFHGENFRSLEMRIAQGLEFLKKNFSENNSGEKNILIITHGVTIQGIMSFLKYGNLDHLNEFSPPENLEMFSFNLKI